MTYSPQQWICLCTCCTWAPTCSFFLSGERSSLTPPPTSFPTWIRTEHICWMLCWEYRCPTVRGLCVWDGKCSFHCLLSSSAPAFRSRLLFSSYLMWERKKAGHLSCWQEGKNEEDDRTLQWGKLFWIKGEKKMRQGKLGAGGQREKDSVRSGTLRRKMCKQEFQKDLFYDFSVFCLLKKTSIKKTLLFRV